MATSASTLRLRQKRWKAVLFGLLRTWVRYRRVVPGRFLSRPVQFLSLSRVFFVYDLLLLTCSASVYRPTHRMPKPQLKHVLLGGPPYPTAYPLFASRTIISFFVSMPMPGLANPAVIELALMRNLALPMARLWKPYWSKPICFCPPPCHSRLSPPSLGSAQMEGGVDWTMLVCLATGESL